MSSEKPYLIVVSGPTGAGKTDIAMRIAKHYDTEIISADSRQIFKEISIGTAKPTSTQLKEVKHYMVNHISIEKDYSAGEFARDSLQILEEIYKKKNVAVLCGGSGLYIKALVEGMDELPKVDKKTLEELNQEKEVKGLSSLVEELKEKDIEYWKTVDQKNPHRIIRALSVIRTSGKTFSELRRGKKANHEFNVIKIGLELPREQLNALLDSRTDSMLNMGLLDEAKTLFKKRGLKSLQTVGYQEIFGHLEGKYDLAEAIRLLKRNTRRYAKRQYTWFKKDKDIRWFGPDQIEKILSYIDNQINN